MKARLAREMYILRNEENIVDQKFVLAEKKRVLFLEELLAEQYKPATNWDVNYRIDTSRK